MVSGLRMAEVRLAFRAPLHMTPIRPARLQAVTLTLHGFQTGKIPEIAIELPENRVFSGKERLDSNGNGNDNGNRTIPAERQVYNTSAVSSKSIIYHRSYFSLTPSIYFYCYLSLLVSYHL
ncbi:hypothetical protein ACLBWT_08135 [Paenibacillus sp. D51F]